MTAATAISAGATKRSGVQSRRSRRRGTGMTAAVETADRPIKAKEDSREKNCHPGADRDPLLWRIGRGKMGPGLRRDDSIGAKLRTFAAALPFQDFDDLLLRRLGGLLRVLALQHGDDSRADGR